MNDLPPAAEKVFAAALAAIRETRGSIAGRFAAALDLFAACRGKVVVTGMGKSGLAARKLAATFASTGCPAIFLNAADALHGDLGVVAPADLVLMLSNNANTDELVRMLPALRRIGVPVVGIFGREGTDLAGAVDLVLAVAAPAEGCPLDLAPMASTLAAIATGDALAAALMERRGFTPEDFALRHPGGSLGRRLLLTAADAMRPAAEVAVVAPEATLRDLVAALTRSPLGAVCVSRDGRLLDGIVSDGDVRRAIMRDDPFALRATDIMTGAPVTVAPHQTLGEVLAVMENPARRIYVVPVTGPGREILGLVRMHDIIS
jgi:arabinose-5-phosphate isomerase